MDLQSVTRSLASNARASTEDAISSALSNSSLKQGACERVRQVKSIVESLLFVADEPVEVGQLAKTLEVEKGLVEEALRSLSREYSQRGLRLQRKNQRVQLVTAPEAAPYIERFLGLRLSSKLSAAALETLAIVAYRQPITRPQIEAIRGVNCDSVLRTLVSKGLIQEVGRLEQVGRPILYGTTFEFLQYFGLQDLAELPPLEKEKPGDEKEGDDASR